MIHKLVVKKVHEDYYSLSDYELIGGRWELGMSYGDPLFWELPEFIQKKHPRKAIKKTGDSYSFYAVEIGFIDPAFIGKGWFNSQGEELPDNNRLMVRDTWL